MKKFLPIFALFLLPSFMMACSCIYSSSFCEHVKSSSKVANVRIINTYVSPWQFSEVLWIDVVVEDNLLGIVEHDTMTILASYGSSCDPDFSLFKIGGHLIVQEGEAITNGPTNWYTFEFDNACNEAFLSLENGIVTGFIKDEYEMQSYEILKDNLGTCTNFTRTFEKDELENSVSIFPVPASDVANIYTPIRFDYDYTLVNVAGQTLVKERVIGETKHPLPISDLPNGLYFLKLQVGQVSIMKRMIVQR